jgi:aminoglycoside phosphotransferase
MTLVLFVFLFFVPAIVFRLAWGAIGTPDEAPKWQRAAARRLDRLAARLRHEHPPVYDPFQTLHLQTRLSTVANHMRDLELDPHTFARAERLIASQLAYDQLLAEACRLAGVEVEEHPKGDGAERFREEVELASRGWAW